MNGIRVTKRKDKDGTITLFIPLPTHLQRTIEGGCDCSFCKANPDKPAKWDTMAISPDGEWTWTVHYPDLQGRESATSHLELKT